MHIVALAWIFVVVLMSLAEATSTQGTLLGAFVTLILYGLLPLAIVLYVMGTPMRRRQRLRRDRTAQQAAFTPDSAAQGDGRGHAASQAVAPIRKEP